MKSLKSLVAIVALAGAFSALALARPADARPGGSDAGTDACARCCGAQCPEGCCCCDGSDCCGGTECCTPKGPCCPMGC